MILSIAQCVWNLTKGIWYLPSFSYPTTKGFEWSFGSYEKWGILASHILLSQKPDFMDMQVIHFD
jgi:hypothetical protein